MIDQKGLMFTPHIVAIEQGTTVEFLNSDKVAHNVFWISVGGNKKLGHNLGTWPKGEKRAFKFDNPGAIPLLCNVHPEMSGYIVVSPTPYFVSDRQVRKLQDRQRSRRQLHRHRVARGREEFFQARNGCGRRQSGFHPDEVRSASSTAGKGSGCKP